LAGLTFVAGILEWSELPAEGEFDLAVRPICSKAIDLIVAAVELSLSAAPAE